MVYSQGAFLEFKFKFIIKKLFKQVAFFVMSLFKERNNKETHFAHKETIFNFLRS